VTLASAWQPEKHCHAKNRQADAEPQKPTLPTLSGAFGQCRQGHAALATLGFF
jgi:hypothetical protein